MMPHYQRFGEQEAQLAQQCQHTSLLHQSTRIGRCAVRRESSLIADADRMPVVVLAMRSHLFQRSSAVNLSVTGDIEMISYIGFNVSQREEDFVGEVSKIATSILRETGRLISRAELAAAMIEELDALYTALRSGETSGYLDEYRHRCVTIGREVQLLWQDTKEKVPALDVDEEFGLIVRRENGTVETVRTGEVSVRGLYGYVE